MRILINKNNRSVTVPVMVLILVVLSACRALETRTPALIELVDMDYRFSNEAMSRFCTENKVDTSNVFRWKNHWVLYTVEGNVEQLSAKLEKAFPRLVMKTYNTPFYNFNRRVYTHEFPASEWSHTIMTANLVKDTVLQNQYMEYHRTQFEKWPEISKGFARADFQQVLVFRNGRQLMLVISVPKGKSLDELNPRTSENNPRVDAWNKLMAKYQEGIEDAPKGTVWVMFQPMH